MTVSRGGFVGVLLLAAVAMGVAAALAALVFVADYLSGLPERPKNSAREPEREAISEIFTIPEPSEPSAETGAFTDARDAEKYRTAKIGGKTWMAENLRYRAGGSWCYGDDTSYCGKYGRLYGWEAAKSACPNGWHLPARLEWLALAEAAGGQEAAGKRLKAKAGWDEDGNGVDSRGFSALPGGSRHHSAGDFSYVGGIGFWWTATEYDGGGDAYIRAMSYGDDDVSESHSGKGGGLSVRCVQDD